MIVRGYEISVVVKGNISLLINNSSVTFQFTGIYIPCLAAVRMPMLQTSFITSLLCNSGIVQTLLYLAILPVAPRA